MKRIVQLALLTVAFAAPVGAQSVGHDIENGFKDILYVWSAPGRIDQDALVPLAGVAAGTGTLMLVDERIYAWAVRHGDAGVLKVLKPFREDSPLSLLGRTFVLIGGSAGLYAIGWAADSRGLQQAGMGCMSAAGAATVSRGVINHIIGRTRPRFGKGAFDLTLFHNDWNRRSMPGGHAAHVMSCVSYWNNRFDLGAAEPILYGVAGAVGVSRIVDGAHWPSDTFVGMAYGWGIGKGIADRYERRATAGRNVPGVALRVSFTF